jgi:hypothetical protein
MRSRVQQFLMSQSIYGIHILRHIRQIVALALSASFLTLAGCAVPFGNLAPALIAQSEHAPTVEVTGDLRALQQVYEQLGVTFSASRQTEGRVRVAGSSADSLVRVELTGDATNIQRASVMITLTEDAEQNQRNTALMSHVIALVAPEWPEGPGRLATQLDVLTQEVQNGNVSAERLQTTDSWATKIDAHIMGGENMIRLIVLAR